MTSTVPSPPSAIGTMSIFALGKTSRSPFAIFSATSRASSERLNLSGAIRMRMRQVFRLRRLCHSERSAAKSRNPSLSDGKRYLDYARHDKNGKNDAQLRQLPLQNFAGQLRIRFSLRKFHHLAFEKIERRRVARFEICRWFRIRGNHLITECFNCAGIA